MQALVEHAILRACTTGRKWESTPFLQKSLPRVQQYSNVTAMVAQVLPATAVPTSLSSSFSRSISAKRCRIRGCFDCSLLSSAQCITNFIEKCPLQFNRFSKQTSDREWNENIVRKKGSLDAKYSVQYLLRSVVHII